MKRCSFLLFLLLLPGALVRGRLAGQALIDSLRTELSAAGNGSARTVLQYDIAHEYAIVDPPQQIIWALRSLQSAAKLKWAAGIANAEEALGDGYCRTGSYDSSLALLHAAGAYYKKAGDLRKLSKTLYRTGYTLELKGDLPMALQQGFAALTLAENNSFAAEKNDALSLIGNIYNESNDYPKAKQYISAAAEGLLKGGDLYNAATCNADLGMLCQRFSQPAAAKKYFQRALEQYTDAQSQPGRITVLLELANLANSLNGYQEAITYAKAAESIALMLHEKLLLVYTYSTFGAIDNAIATDTVHVAPGNRGKALREMIRYYEQARALETDLGNLSIMQNTAFNLAQAYQEAGDYKNALDEYQHFILFRDSLMSEANKEKITRISKQRDEDLKQKRIEVQALQIRNAGLQRIFLLAGIIMLAGVGALIFRQSVIRRKANSQLQHLNTALDANNKELDEANRSKARFFGILSHDLRAPIARLISFLTLQRQAPEIMDEAAWHSHQQQTETGAHNLLSVMEELLLWSKGQMQHFKPQMEWVSVDNLFDALQILLPAGTGTGMVFENSQSLRICTDANFLKTIMRNLTANAAKALAGQSNGTIIWTAWEEIGQICLSIADNGPGMSREMRDNLFSVQHITSSGGLGLNMVRDFARLLSIRIEVQSEEGRGTTFILRCPAGSFPI